MYAQKCMHKKQHIQTHQSLDSGRWKNFQKYRSSQFKIVRYINPPNTYISMQNSNNSYDDSLVGTNKELLYANHILSTLKDAQSSFGSVDGKVNVQRFLLYCAYLENAVLDDKTRERIMKERTEEKLKLQKENLDADTIKFHEAFVTIKYVMKYLNDIMDLETKDIVGVVSKEDTEEYNLFEEDSDE